jgi:hypothetical protein
MFNADCEDQCLTRRVSTHSQATESPYFAPQVIIMTTLPQREPVMMIADSMHLIMTPAVHFARCVRGLGRLSGAPISSPARGERDRARHLVLDRG